MKPVSPQHRHFCAGLIFIWFSKLCPFGVNNGSACQQAFGRPRRLHLCLLVVPSPSGERHYPRHWLRSINIPLSTDRSHLSSPLPWLTTAQLWVWICRVYILGPLPLSKENEGQNETRKIYRGEKEETISGLERLSNPDRHRPKLGLYTDTPYCMRISGRSPLYFSRYASLPSSSPPSPPLLFFNSKTMYGDGGGNATLFHIRSSRKRTRSSLPRNRPSH